MTGKSAYSILNQKNYFAKETAEMRRNQTKAVIRHSFTESDVVLNHERIDLKKIAANAQRRVAKKLAKQRAENQGETTRDYLQLRIDLAALKENAAPPESTVESGPGGEVTDELATDVQEAVSNDNDSEILNSEAQKEEEKDEEKDEEKEKVQNEMIQESEGMKEKEDGKKDEIRVADACEMENEDDDTLSKHEMYWTCPYPECYYKVLTLLLYDYSNHVKHAFHMCMSVTCLVDLITNQLTKMDATIKLILKMKTSRYPK